MKIRFGSTFRIWRSFGEVIPSSRKEHYWFKNFVSWLDLCSNKLNFAFQRYLSEVEKDCKYSQGLNIGSGSNLMSWREDDWFNKGLNMATRLHFYHIGQLWVSEWVSELANGNNEANWRLASMCISNRFQFE